MKHSLLFAISLFFGILSYAQMAQKIDFPVNTPDAAVTAPCISPDGKTMVYISDKAGYPAFYQSTLQVDGSWTPPLAIEAINKYANIDANLASPVLDYNGTKLYFSANIPDKGLGGVDIYYAEKKQGVWSEPINLGEPVNSAEYDGMPSVTIDTRYIYFARNNTLALNKDFDCKVIYFSYKNDDGSWRKPEAMPIPVNLDCECAPRIATDGKTLIFSSVREAEIDDITKAVMEPLGGFDLYYTKMLAKNVWSTPRLFSEANSENDDMYASIPASGDKMYYSSSGISRHKEFGQIYKIDLPDNIKPGKNITLTGKIQDLNTNQPLTGRIVVTDPRSSRILSVYENSPVDGRFYFVLNAGQTYKIDVQKDGYSHSFFTVDAEQLSQNETIEKNITLYKTVKLIFNVFDSEIFEPLPGTIKISDAVTGQTVNVPIDQVKTGRFSLELPIGTIYQIDVDYPHYDSYGISFDLTGVVQFDEFERDVELNVQKQDFIITVSDEQTNKNLQVDIIAVNLDRDEVIETKATQSSNGTYVIQLRQGDRYEVNVKNPKGYAYYNTTVDMSSGNNKLDVKLTPLNANTKIMLNDITFETNSAALNASSYEELDRVAKLVNDNPDIKVEISAHTDNVGADAYNLKLSEKRAQSVVDYLIEKGVKITQLLAKGYGEATPVVANDTDENKARNRRVEFKILEVN